MKPTRRTRVVLALAALLLAATASQAVVIYFKDGSKEILADRYRVDGDRIIAVLQSGQETAIPLAAVDLEKTEAMSKVAKGSAVVIDRVQDGDVETLKQARTVADLMRERSTLPTPAPLAENTSRTLRYTPAGNVDFLNSSRRQLTPAARATLVESLLDSHGLSAAAAYQGTQANRVLIDIVAATRGEVFEALQSSAAMLLELRQAWPEVRGLELAMATGTRSRAGQFVLTPEQAELLASGGTTPAEFFVANVLF
jgi:hypothetical protein